MQERHRIALTYNAYLLFYHYDLCLINLPAVVINEAIKYIMHTSIGAKLLIYKLDYCLKVDEPSTNAKKMGYVYVFALNFQYNLRQAIKYCKIRLFNACRLQIGRVGTYTVKNDVLY